MPLSRSTKPPIILSLFVMHTDNRTAFQYTLPRTIISHRNRLSNALLRILHCNEMCPLCMNLPTPFPDFTPPPIRGRDTQEVIIGILSKSDSFLEKDQFPSMHFLIITLSRPQTIIWICHALFVLPTNCINHERARRLAEREELPLKYKAFTCCGPLRQKVIL